MYNNYIFNILSFCSNADVLSTMKIVKIIINIIRTIVPIILILSIAFSFTNAVKSNEDDIFTKTLKNTIPKLVTIVLIFFIPTFVNIILSITLRVPYNECFEKATTEGINSAYYESALSYIDQTKNSLKRSDYQSAKKAFNNIKDDSIKSSLQSEMEKLEEYLELQDNILNLKVKFDRDKYKEYYKKVESIEDENIKEKLLLTLATVKNGAPLNIEPGIHLLTYDGMEYYEIVPPIPTTNMPLLIYLHGDGEFGKGFYNLATSRVSNYFLNGTAFDIEDFLVLMPKGGNQNNWLASGIPEKIIGLINYKLDDYQMDVDRVILTGHSRGAIGAWGIANRYPDLFSALIPVSCNPAGINVSNFANICVRAFNSSHGGDEIYYRNVTANYISQIQSIGGPAEQIVIPDATHSALLNYLLSDDTITWALDQVKQR